MKKKEFWGYREKTKEDVEKAVREYRERFLTLRFDLARGKVKNIREIRSVKKSIAQLLTLLKLKQ